MPIKRVVIEIDFDNLSFEELSRAAQAISVLEALAKDDLVAMETIAVKGKGVLRKRRSDAKQEKALQPQSRAILAHLEKIRTPATVSEIAEATGINSNSVRAQLHLLLNRKYVERAGEGSSGAGRKSLQWQIAS